MRPAFGGDRPRRKPHINITSLIDVMFILLIFVLVTTTFREHLGVVIELPRVGGAEPREMGPRELIVTESGQMYLGERRVNEQELRAALVDLFAAEPDATLVLRADSNADFGDVIRAIDISSRIGGQRFIIPTRTDDEAPR